MDDGSELDQVLAWVKRKMPAADSSLSEEKGEGEYRFCKEGRIWYLNILLQLFELACMN